MGRKTLPQKILGFIDSAGRTLDLIEETRIKPIKPNLLEDILFSAMVGLTALTSAYFFREGGLKSSESQAAYAGAALSTISFIAYRIKRYYDEFKKRGKIC